MGIFSRMKRGIKAQANAAIDKIVDPEKELDMVILELEEQRKKALAELLSYKATAKSMEQDLARYEEKAASWEKRAMAAVKSGDDEMARKALKEKKLCEAEVVKIRRDRDEAAGYAIELNRSRKQFETKLKILKLKKGTLATQIASARSGGDSPFGDSQELFDKFKRAEDAIDDEAIQAEVDSAIEGGELGGTSTTELELLGGGSADDPDAALAHLKSKMLADKAKKQKPE